MASDNSAAAEPAAAGPALALDPVWTFEGKEPECAVYDPRTKQIYVSHMSAVGTEPAGNGYVSRLTPDGALIQPHWISNLKCPAGISVIENELYINDYDRVLIADTRSGKILAVLQAPNSRFLDGMATDTQHDELYLSDIWDNTIWKLSRRQRTLERWVTDSRLDNPDGLVAEANRLVVGSFALAKDLRDEQGRQPPRQGHLLTIDYATAEISTLGDGSPIANHDGLCSDGQGGYWTSDHVEGSLISIGPSGAIRRKYFIGPTGRLSPHHAWPSRAVGPADIRFEPALGLLFVPLLKCDRLAAYCLAA